MWFRTSPLDGVNAVTTPPAEEQKNKSNNITTPSSHELTSCSSIAACNNSTTATSACCSSFYNGVVGVGGGCSVVSVRNKIRRRKLHVQFAGAASGTTTTALCSDKRVKSLRALRNGLRRSGNSVFTNSLDTVLENSCELTVYRKRDPSQSSGISVSSLNAVLRGKSALQTGSKSECSRTGRSRERVNINELQSRDNFEIPQTFSNRTSLDVLSVSGVDECDFSENEQRDCSVISNSDDCSDYDAENNIRDTVLVSCNNANSDIGNVKDKIICDNNLSSVKYDSDVDGKVSDDANNTEDDKYDCDSSVNGAVTPLARVNSDDTETVSNVDGTVPNVCFINRTSLDENADIVAVADTDVNENQNENISPESDFRDDNAATTTTNEDYVLLRESVPKIKIQRRSLPNNLHDEYDDAVSFDRNVCPTNRLTQASTKHTSSRKNTYVAERSVSEVQNDKINQNDVRTTPPVAVTLRKSRWWSTNDNCVITTLEHLESQWRSSPSPKVDKIDKGDDKKQSLKKTNRFSDSSLLMTYRQSFKNKFSRKATNTKDALKCKNMDFVDGVVAEPTSPNRIDATKMDERLYNGDDSMSTKTNDEKRSKNNKNDKNQPKVVVKRAKSRTRERMNSTSSNAQQRDRISSSSNIPERRNSISKPKDVVPAPNVKKTKSKRFSTKKKDKKENKNSEPAPPDRLIENVFHTMSMIDPKKHRKKSESLEDVSRRNSVLFDDEVVIRNVSVASERKQKSNSNIGVASLIDSTANVFGKVSLTSNRPKFSKSKSYSSINLNSIMRSRRKTIKDDDSKTNHQRCENEFEFIAFGAVATNPDFLGRKFSNNSCGGETLKTVREDSQQHGAVNSNKVINDKVSKSNNSSVKSKVSPKTSWLRGGSKKSTGSTTSVSSTSTISSSTGERPFPSAPVSRAGSDRRSDASETLETPDQELDNEQIHDNLNRTQRPKNTQSSINRSESYKEHPQKRRQVRERRKVSDPNLSKSNDVEPESQGLSYTNSGSSSNSSLSSSSPSTSLEAVPMAVGCTANTRIAGDSDPETERLADPSDWASTVPEDLLSRLSGCEKKRQEVFNELFQTERSHVRQLRVLRTIFHKPLLGSNLLSSHQISLLFPNLDEMLNFHSTFCNDMKALRKENPLVKDIGETLLKTFDGEKGEDFQKEASIFCAKQQIALEWLKDKRHKDQKLHAFLSECESDKLCKRLQLKDLIPTGMLRLTKYPLLFENLVKYTEQCLKDENSINPLCSEELSRILRAHDRSKEILNFVNATVREAEDLAKLQDFQKRLDRSGFEKTEHPITVEFKNIDLTKHKLIHEGPLHWRIGTRQKISLHVLLLQEIIILLQKQDEKYSLKFHNVSGTPGLDRMSPIIKVSTVLVRSNATNPNSLFLINTAQMGEHMYELVASSPSECKLWFRHISEATELYIKSEGRIRSDLPASIDTESDNNSESTLVGTDNRNTECDNTSIDESRSSDNNSLVSQSQDGGVTPTDRNEEDTVLEHKRLTQIDDGDSPSTQGPNLGSQGSLNRFGAHSPLTYCREQSQLIPPSEVHISVRPVLTAEPVLTPLEQLRRKDELVKQTLSEKEMLVADILSVPRDDFKDIADLSTEYNNDKEPTELVLGAIHLSHQLIEAINEASNITDETTIALTTLPNATTSHLVVGCSGNSPKLNRLPGVPIKKLSSISSTLNSQLTELLKKMKERDEEREKLRRELHRSREQIHILHEIHRLHPDIMVNAEETLQINRLTPEQIENGVENSRRSTVIEDSDIIKEEPSDCEEEDINDSEDSPKNSNN